MPRKAVQMSQAEFETLLNAWAHKMEFLRDGGDEPYVPETVQAQTARQVKEAQDSDNYGIMYPWDMKIHTALKACEETDNVVSKDLSKVNFDWENCGCDLANNGPCGFWMTSTGVPMLGCYAGGDWEDPVYFVLYPESTTSIRAYMPKAGNTWNIKTKTAWGSGDEGDQDPDENPRKVDVAAFRADVDARIQAK